MKAGMFKKIVNALNDDDDIYFEVEDAHTLIISTDLENCTLSLSMRAEIFDKREDTQ